MLGIVQKLCSISGMLEMLSCMEGCTITPATTSLLIDAVEILDGVTDELMKHDEGVKGKASGGFIRMDE